MTTYNIYTPGSRNFTAITTASSSPVLRTVSPKNWRELPVGKSWVLLTQLYCQISVLAYVELAVTAYWQF